MSRAQAFSSFLFDSVNIIGTMRDEDLVFFLKKPINSQRRKASKTVNINQGRMKAKGYGSTEICQGEFRRISHRWFALGCSFFFLNLVLLNTASLGCVYNNSENIFM